MEIIHRYIIEDTATVLERQHQRPETQTVALKLKQQYSIGHKRSVKAQKGWGMKEWKGMEA